jgi:ferrous iron transport protein B
MQKQSLSTRDKTVTPNANIIVLGFPNAGKTSLFNTLTGSNYKTVNYPGSTVEYATGNCQKISKQTITIIDTPGLRSFNPKSSDEAVTLKVLNTQLVSENPIHVFMVLDYTQLERQLVIAYSFSQLKIPMTVILTKKDHRKQNDMILDQNGLSERIGYPVIELNTQLETLPASFITYLDKLPYSKHPLSTELNQLQTRSIIDDFAWTEQTLKTVGHREKNSRSSSQPSFDLDRLFLHPILGGVFFLMIMSGLFWAVFTLASPLMMGIDGGVTALALWSKSILPNGYLSQLISDGLITGIGAFLVFTPQIFLLFFLMGILEESGYLARGAIIVDKPLSLVGLSGKSFVPLLSGCACAIPAMMAARTISNTKERLITLFIIPLMTCSARLPVYGLLIAVLFLPNSSWSGVAFTGIYIGSVILASITAAIVGRVMGLDKTEVRFDMVLPTWHWPQWRKTVRYSSHQTWRFCKNAGPIILCLSVIIWALSTFPSPEQSIIRWISEYLDPLLRPMGVDGRVGMALLLAFIAREVFVSALALIFAVSETNTIGLIDQLSHATLLGTNTPLLTPSSTVGLIVFFMIAMQCISTLAVAKQESRSWRLPLIMMGVYTIAAYVLAVIAVQGLRLLGFS